MLRSTRLPPGHRALVPHSLAPTSTSTIAARPVSFATRRGRTTRPFTFAGAGGTLSSSPSSSGSYFLRPPSTWSPSTIATIAGGAMLVGTWYVVEEGRSYKVAAEADKYEPRVLGAKRVGKVNPDYVSYEHWVERHKRKSEGGRRGAGGGGGGGGGK